MKKILYRLSIVILVITITISLIVTNQFYPIESVNALTLKDLPERSLQVNTEDEEIELETQEAGLLNEIVEDIVETKEKNAETINEELWRNEFEENGEMVMFEVSNVVTNILDYIDVSEVNIFDYLGNMVSSISNEQIRVRYDFSVEGAIVNDGDYAIFPMPKQIRLNSSYDTPVYVSGFEGVEDYLLFTIYLDDSTQTVKLVFESLINDVEGTYFDFWGYFDHDMIGKGQSEDLNFQIGNDKNIIITIDLGDLETDINKRAINLGYVEGVGYVIEWQIIVNDQQVSLKNLKVVDVLGEGLNYIPQSMSVSPNSSTWTFDEEQAVNTGLLQWDYWGETSETYVMTFLSVVNDFSDYQSYNVQDVTYYSIDNNVTFYYMIKDGIEEFLKANAVVQMPVKLIDKKGQQIDNTSKIEWSTTINHDGVDISRAIITDNILAGLNYDYDSFRLYLVNDLETPLNLSDYGVLTETKQGFTFVFNDFIENNRDSFVIKYTSTIVDENFFTKNQIVVFENQIMIELKNGIKGLENACKTIANVSAKSTLLVKSGVVESNLQGVLWAIEVNENENYMENVIVSDFIPDGLAIDEALNDYGVIIYKGNNEVYQGAYTVEYLDDVLSINFNEPIVEKLIIRFKTKIVDYDLLTSNSSRVFQNKAVLIVNGSTESFLANVHVNNNILSKTSTIYNPADKTMGWRIYVNENRFAFKGELIIKDTITNGQSLLVDSIKVSNANGVVFKADIDYTIQASEEEFVIIFRDLDSVRYIEFDTQLSDLSIFEKTGEIKISNEASLTSSISNKEVIVSDSRYIQNTVISKRANFSTGQDYIDWIVTINSNAVDWDLTGATLTDELQVGLLLDVGSIRLVQRILKSDGSYMDNKVIPLTNDNIIYDLESNVFTFIFPEVEVGYAYQLLFITDVLESGNYSNSITLDGVVSGTGSSSVINIDLIGAGGGGVITERSTQLVIKKIDSVTNLPLGGVSFELYDEMGVLIRNSQTTDENGDLIFSRLSYNTYYYLKEVSTLEGYALSNDMWEIFIEKDAVTKPYAYHLIIENTPIKGDIIITKYGEELDFLSGAEFTLYNGEEIIARSNPLFDEEGMERVGYYIISDIGYGKYSLLETTAPKGYNLVLDSNNKDIEITELNQVIEVDYYNVKTEIILSKQNEYQEPLDNAVFELSREVDGFWEVIDSNIISDELGYISIKGLLVGHYRLVEIEAPSGYVIDQTIFEFKMMLNSEGIIYPYTLDNNQIKRDDIVLINYQGRVFLRKINSNGEGLAAAEFDLYQKIGDVSVKVNQLPIISDEFGLVGYFGLEPGDYYFVETKAPKGYILNELPSELFRVEEKYLGELPVISLGDFMNYQGCVELYKTNEFGEFLSDVSFDLYQLDNNQWIKIESNLITGVNGEIILENLVPGLYKLIEISTQLGYQLDNTPIDFEILESSLGEFKVIKLEHINRLINEEQKEVIVDDVLDNDNLKTDELVSNNNNLIDFIVKSGDSIAILWILLLFISSGFSFAYIYNKLRKQKT
jgi:Predicted outer membrane protein